MKKTTSSKEQSPPEIHVLGSVVEKIDVQLSTRFLEHFSEQLYSSPNKAFEELVSNAWDAGAKTVFIEIPGNLLAPKASLLILDDGGSMDASGLHDLWKVAYSAKREAPPAHGRSIIGKFGIGKLATYVLANKLTYVCKASDRVIRVVTMDYGQIDGLGKKGAGLLKDLALDLREAQWDQVAAALEEVQSGLRIRELIEGGIPAPPREEEWENEYGGEKPLPVTSHGCWTLVVLSDLKERGREIQKGVIRRMMQTALPLGADLNIVLNGELLNSSKIDRPVMKDWTIGTDFAPAELEVPPEDPDTGVTESLGLKSITGPQPRVELPEIGMVSGRIRLYADKISGGKSEELAASNGFFINVLGRVANNDPAFGEKDLSHSAWARFRMTVRADGLDALLAVNREQFFQSRAMRVFRAFLRRGFNVARAYYDDVANSAWAETGKVIVDSWGTLPLQPLQNFVTQNLVGPTPIAGLVDLTGTTDSESTLKKWKDETDRDMRKVIQGVKFEESDPEQGVAHYRVADRTLVVNSVHPFVQEHFTTREEQRVVRNFALLDFLTDVYAFDIGLEPTRIEEIRKYRDGTARLIARIDRRSGVQIARMLIEVSTYKDYRAFEIIVSDALDYLGFSVERMAVSGDPEGIARAYPTPMMAGGTQLYSFSFDAKSSKHGKVKTKDVNAGGLARHRNEHSANHALVVAPEFEQGALEKECEANDVTPMRARDLGKLLQLAAEYGAIPLTKFREVLHLRSPQSVSDWTDSLDPWLAKSRVLTLDLFIAALGKVEKMIPDVLNSGVIAVYCRELSGREITANNVIELCRGLQILVPDLVRVENKDVVISAHPDKLVAAVSAQLNKIKTAPASIFAQGD